MVVMTFHERMRKAGRLSRFARASLNNRTEEGEDRLTRIWRLSKDLTRSGVFLGDIPEMVLGAVEVSGLTRNQVAGSIWFGHQAAQAEAVDG